MSKESNIDSFAAPGAAKEFPGELPEEMPPLKDPEPAPTPDDVPLTSDPIPLPPPQELPTPPEPNEPPPAEAY